MGALQNWQPGHSLQLSDVGVCKGKEEQLTSYRFSEKRFLILPTTQFWLHGEKRTLQNAQKYLVDGTKLFIAVRWREYSDKTKLFNAHAVFDWQTWQAYAHSELGTATGLFLPRTPQYERKKD